MALINEQLMMFNIFNMLSRFAPHPIPGAPLREFIYRGYRPDDVRDYGEVTEFFSHSRKTDTTVYDHLRELQTPTLILQGTRDSLGKRDEVSGYSLSPAIRVEWLEDGDHSFKPRKRSGLTHEEHLAAAAEAIVSFIKQTSRV